MAKQNQYHIYTHDDTSLTTVKDFVNDISSIGSGLTIKELLTYQDEEGNSNLANIIELYNPQEYEDNKSIINQYINTPPTLEQSQSNQTIGYSVQNTDEAGGDLPLKIGTVLAIPLIKIDRDLLISESNQVVDQTTFQGFYAKKLVELLRDKGNQRIYQDNASIESVKEVFPHFSVWIWSRAASVSLNGDFKHSIINITPFVTSVNTGNTANGGNFSVTISPVSGEYKDEKWRISYPHDYKNLTVQSFTHDMESKRTNLVHNLLLQQNDVVFISFESLLLENDRARLEEQEEISIYDLPNSVFDMIGLIDHVPNNATYSQVGLGISITGRDLVKLLIEDGVYFYPLQFTDGGIFANMSSGAGDERIQRYNGEIFSRFQQAERTISRTMKYIINALGAIRICPDDLFDPYKSVNGKDIRSRNYQLTTTSLTANKTKAEEQQDKVRQAKKLIKQSIESEELTKTPSEDQANSIYFTIYEFLDTLYNEQTKPLTERLNNLQGWDGVTYQGEELVQNQLPTSLDDSLYKNKRGWRDSKGRILNDAQKKAVVAQIEKDLDSQQAKINATKLGGKFQKELERKEKDKKDLIEKKKRQLDLNVLLKEQNAAFAAADQSEETAQQSGNSFIQLPKLEQERKASLTILEARYSAIKRTGDSIQLVILHEFYTDLNTYAKQAFDIVYGLVKDNQESKVDEREQKPLKGIWQLIDLVIDKSIANRRVVDSSIGNETGSLINAIRKICQEPFVEFFTDTYGNKFQFIVRKPPFDKQSLVSILSNQVSIASASEQVIRQTQLPPPVLQGFTMKNGNLSNAPDVVTTDQESTIIIDINDIDIDSDTLDFDTIAYSWYRLQPQNLIGGNDSDFAFAYLKAIYFPEFADVFGSKPLDVINNYIPFFPTVGKNQSVSTAYCIRQAMYDLKFLIESNCYLPFTRKGTITLRNGDRRIKRGTWVRYVSTGELCYVDSVSQECQINNNSITRGTTLQVSRCMIEKHINPNPSIDGETYSYFNICATPIDEAIFSNQQFGYTDFNKTVTSNWKVNPRVFNFFLKRMQFAQERDYRLEFNEGRKNPINQNLKKTTPSNIA